MKVTFLGTGASEGIPSMYCKCGVCENARKVGGKEVRFRMGMLVNRDLMIDFSPDSLYNSIRYGIDFSKLKGILITHTHSDHLDLESIEPRIRLEEDVDVPSWNIYATGAACKLLKDKKSLEALCLNRVYLKVPFNVGDYKITPLDANHIINEDSATYLIEKDGKTYLHLCDTGEIDSSVYEYLHKNGVKVDLAVVDCTYGLIEKEYCGHLNLNQVVKLCDNFKRLGVFGEQTQTYLTHVCHWGGSHENLEKKASEYGLKVAYDGLEVQI